MRKTLAFAFPSVAVFLLGAATLLGSSAAPLVWLPLSLAAAAVGALLWYRRAGGVIGALFVTVGLSIPVNQLFGAYARVTPARDLPGGPWAAVLFQATIAGALGFFLILQLFPAGRPLAGWRWLVYATVVNGTLLFAVPAIGTSELFRANFPGIEHPLQLVSPSLSGALYDGSNTASLVVFALSALTIVLRYRRSTGEERAQLTWFVAAAVVVVVGLTIGLFLDPDGPAVVFALLAPAIPVAAGIAILRYHLYDIDVVISKALLLALVAAAITAVYVAVVVGVGALTGAGRSEILSIAATALVAVVFQPIRERAQRLANRLVYGERATPYEVMAGFSSRVADTVSTDDVLPEMAEAVGRGVGAVEATARVHLPEGADRVQRWVADGAPDRAGEPWTIQIAYQGQPVGELTVRKPLAEPLTPGERHLLEDLGSQAGLALHNVRLSDELAIRLRELDAQAAALRVSRERLVTAREAQRRGLQRDIQEGPERQLIDIGRRLSVVDGPDALDPLIDRANETLEDLRDLARGIFPPLLADQGIVAALEAHIRKIGAQADMEPDHGIDGARFEADVEACVYFCCLQALQNVQRHAGNAPTTIHLSIDSEALVFTIEDHGPGFDVERTRRGMGLQIIQDRVDALDGSLTVTSSPSGTTVRGRVPAPSHDVVGARR